MLNAFKEVQNVLLIGSSSEIGIATIMNLPTSVDSRLILVGRNDNHTKELREKFSEVFFIAYDMNANQDLEILLENINKFGDVDVAVIAAGVLGGDQTQMENSDLQELFKVNFVASALILGSLTRKMIGQGHGKIAIVSSLASLRPRKNNYAYGTSKVAIDFFARGLTQELSDSNVTISIIRPGFVFSKMTSHLKPSLFATIPEVVGKIAAKGIMNKQKIIYTPKKLSLLSFVIRVLPLRVLNKLG